MPARWYPTEKRILAVLGDGAPKSHREIVNILRLSESAAWGCLRRCWRKQLVLRSQEPIRKAHRVFKGRAGISRNLRSYHLYVVNTGKGSPVIVNGVEFVQYEPKSRKSRSKAQLILDYLKDHSDRAHYSVELAKNLESKGVRIADIMANARRFERKGWVYVRGYRTGQRQTPFQEGYILTWVDPALQREKAIEEAVERTDKALAGRASTNPMVERVNRVRDMIQAVSQTGDIASQPYINNELGCSQHEAHSAIERALQLFPTLKEVKLFGAYKHYYHTSMSLENLQAAISMKENYIRKEKGAEQRIGHNWEAAVEWFVDKFTTGAKFREQPHRSGNEMDKRRITLHLLKSVGGRRNNAEVDRVWTVTPGPFAPPTTYVLEGKWGLVRKGDVDDFLGVLKWSTDFGVDTPEGRQVKQGVTGVFAGNAFKPDDKVTVDGKTISLAEYANRLNISLLKASDFNMKLRERGCKPSVSIQKICGASRDEDEVRTTLEAIWDEASDAESILKRLLGKNEDLYDFERMLKEEPKKNGLVTSASKLEGVQGKDCRFGNSAG